MKFRHYLSLLTFFIVAIVNAQNIEIQGKVTDSKNEMPISGVNVLVKSTKKGVTTDFDGNYSVKVKANDILVFTFVGFAPKEIKVEKSQTVNIQLQEEANKLEEVVVNVGYGTQKKKNISSAISTVKSDAFDDRPIFNVGQAIQGNAAGVQVVQPSGKPGVGMDIKIRGLSSISSGNGPLYVIDGIQTFDSSGISTEDIVDIQILKDATATAIYGVNGSGGVVLITTKRGKVNTNTFNFSSYIGESKVVKMIDVLNLDQYKTLMGEMTASTTYLGMANASQYAGIQTNWADKVFQTGLDKNLDFSYSGGTDKIKAFTSLGYQENQGIIKPSNFSRISGRINLDIDAAKWLKAHVNMNLFHTEMNNTQDNKGADRGGVILSALMTPQYLPVYAEELKERAHDPITGGYLYDEQDGMFALNPLTKGSENPVVSQSIQDVTKMNRFMSNIGFDVTVLKNLVWKPSLTFDSTRRGNDFFVDSYRSSLGRGSVTNLAEQKGQGTRTTSTKEMMNIENTLNYNIKSENHDLNLLVGASFQKERYDELRISGTGFAPNLRELDLNQMMLVNRFASDTIAREKIYLSYFGRATYNFKGKYIINGVMRASGASQLAPGHKWGYFPGVSAAWIVSNENFLKESKYISEFKIRGGWGQSGNISSINEYSSYGLLWDDHGAQSNYVNFDLTWETTTDKSVGIDVGILNNRVKFTVDAFQKLTNNLIYDINFPGLNPKYTYNAGEIENKGLEFALNTINFKGDFNWNTNFNITFIKNKVLAVGYQPVETAGVNRIEAGQPLGNFYGYVVDRVNPTTGYLEFKDLNGNGVIDVNDRTIIGNALPKYTFGFSNNFSFKGFSLDALITSSQGNDIYNQSRIKLEGMEDSQNQSVAVLDRWTTVGQITDMPRPGTNVLNTDGTWASVRANDDSSRWVEDGSYVRLKAVTFSYTFKKFWGINSLKCYVTGQNLYTWTKYKGFDPEVSAFGNGTGRQQGIDYGTYPQIRTFIVGLKASF